MPYSILVVDDEALTLRTVGRALQGEGYEVLVAGSGEEALQIFAEQRPELALVDVVLPGMNGIEVLRQMRSLSPSTVVMMMSAYHTVERAVEAMKLGAHDYLVKPFQLSDLVRTAKRATEMLALRTRLRENIATQQGRYDMGRATTYSPAMRQLLDMAYKAAEADRTTILIQGESGTGKEVLAKAIHYHSPRSGDPFVELNCAALPDTLMESELFGYEPGAFTDARRRKEGLLEKANGGTLFLDEVGNMSGAVQAKVLKVLEEGNFTRLGGTRTLQVDVRVIAATNKLLKEAVQRQEFREDLYYRLNVVPLFIPPLRERSEDILPLCHEMMRRYNQELKKNFTGFTPDAAEMMERYPWPGNIRELKNAMERMMILAPEGEIDVFTLPEEVRDYAPSAPAEESCRNGGERFTTLRDLEQRYIHQVLAATGNNKTHAARILGIHSTSLMRRLKKESEEPEAVSCHAFE